MINTKFWDDAYTSSLDPIEKLLFLYFLTNTSTTICGIYEIPLKKIANETGIDKDMVEKVLTRFEKDHKIYFRNGWIGLVNFIKNQNQQSPKVKKGIEVEMLKAPETIKSLVLLKGIDTLSHSNSNLNLNSTQSNTPILTIKKDGLIKRIYGEFGEVKVTDVEYDKLVAKFGEPNTLILITELDTGIASKGYRYKNHYATLLNWGRRKITEHVEKTNKRTII